MSAFVDKLLLKLRDPAAVKTLIAPPTDATFAAVKALFAAVYELPFASLASVKSVDVVWSEFERPIFVPERRTGTWTQTVPSHQRTDVVYESTNGSTPLWVDVVTELRVTAVLNADAGVVDTVEATSIDDFTSLAQFKAKFQFFDLDAFMADHGITTAAELKALAHYLLAEIKLKARAPFNANDAANERRFALKLAILIRDAVDVAAALRDAKLTVARLESTTAYVREVDEAEVRTPLAPVVIFPDNAVPAGVPAADLKSLFAGERVLVLLAKP